MGPSHVSSRQGNIRGLTTVSAGRMVVVLVAFLREDFALQYIELRLVLFRQQEPEETEDDEPLQPFWLFRAVILVIVVDSTGATSTSLPVLAASVHVRVRFIGGLNLFGIVSNVGNQSVNLVF